MDDVFLSEVELNGQADWETIGVGEVSLLPGCAEGDTDVLAVQIDIASPLSTLKAILQQKLGVDFTNCELWLQDILQLNEENTLSEQCIQGEGLVQVNLELKSEQGVLRINILDVLRPPDEEPAEAPEAVTDGSSETLTEAIKESQSACDVVPQNTLAIPDKPPETTLGPNGTVFPSTSIGTISPAMPVKSSISSARNLKPLASAASENITRWVMDSGFRKDQDRLKIPLDPVMWTQVHVQHWIVWAINQFNLKNVNPAKWGWIDGPALCNMTHAEFTEKVPNDPNDLFWTHLELLRKCKFVGVIQKPVPFLQYVTTPLTVKADAIKSTSRPANFKASPTKVVQPDASAFATTMLGGGNRTAGSNGQVQLWQFLLELLTDKNFRDAISWLGTGGEFKLNNPEMVAQLWGERKNKPNMNYEKLSRALRYYYDGDMICKVSGKRFVYKFVCDLKQLLGYSADELNKLVIECEQRSRAKRDPFYAC